MPNMPSEPRARHPQLVSAAVLIALAALLLARLSSFGIWDPWELAVAEDARRLAEGRALQESQGPAGPSMAAWVASLGFRLFGAHDWAGRLPVALTALATTLATLVMVTRRVDGRSGRYAAVVLATTPLFLLNGRPLAGAAPDFLLQTLVAWGGIEALLGTAGGVTRWLWAAVATGAAALSGLGSGVLLGPLPPLLGLAAVVWVCELGRDPDRRPVAAYFVAGAAGTLASTVAAVFADNANSLPWTGGLPQGVAPPTYDHALERVLHAGAPWSAIVPVALGQFVAATWVRGKPAGTSATGDGPARSGRRALQVLAVVWAAAGYAGMTVFLARYGEATTYLPVAALAVLVALFLGEVAEAPRPRTAAGIGILLLVGLLVRDYVLFPESPIRGLSMERFELPEAFNPKREWTLLLGGFGAVTLLVLAVGHRRPNLLPQAPYLLLRRQWQRGWGTRAWLLGLGTALFAMLVCGGMARFWPGSLGLSVLGQKLVRRLFFVPLAIPVGVLALQLLWAGVGRLGRFQVVAILVTGALTGAYTGHGFLPAVSDHLSPKEVYATYQALAKPGEPLVEYGVDGRAAAYYVDGDVIEADNTHDVLNHLLGDGRRWAAFPSSRLGTLNRLFRKRTGRHLFVADAESARIVLAANQPVPGLTNRNYFAKHILRESPTPEYPVGAVFDDRVELLGYDLDLPHDGYLGAGESFWITWYFKVRKPLGGNQRVFVHVDSRDQRIHGDHDPLDGRYPTRQWQAGDILADRHRLEAANNQRPGTYRIYMGLYAGESRLPVTEGPKDDANRVKAGVLRIR